MKMATSLLTDRLPLPHRTFLPLLVTLGVAVLWGSVVGAQDVIVHDTVSYAKPKLNTSYQSSAKFDPRGMEHLYTITNFFLDLVLHDNTKPPFIKQSTERIVQSQKDGNVTAVLLDVLHRHWDDLVLYYLPLVIIIGIGLLLVILVPIVGLFFCCCRCAGRCGGKENPFDRKYDRCRRVVDGFILSLFVVLILFGVVCAFVTNEYLRQGVHQLPSRVDTSLSDVELYLNNTNKEMDTLLITNFQQLQETLEESLDDCGMEIKDELGRISKAAAIDNLTDIVEGLVYINQDLNLTVIYTNILQYNAANLNDELQETQAELNILLQNCSEKACQRILDQYDLSQLEVQADFQQYLANVLLPKLPNVTQTAEEISQLIEDNIEREVRAGQVKFDSISYVVQREVDSTVPQVKVQIQKVGEELQQVALNITDFVRKIDLTPVKKAIGERQPKLDEYSQYRYYVGLGVCGAVLLVLLCFIGGICCGCCGKRPGNVYGDDSCNKGAGANFLLAAIHLTFLLFSVLMLATTVLFIAGSLTGLLVCDELEANDSNLTILQLTDDLFIHIDQLYPADEPVTLVDIIRDCNRNLSAYQVLRLSSMVNITEILDYRHKFGIDAQIDELKRSIKVNTADIKLLSDVAKEHLRELANSTLAYINYTAYTVTLEEQITSVDLNELADALNDAAADISSSSIREGVDRMAQRLRAEQGMVNELKVVVRNLKEATSSLERHVMLNRTSLTEAVNELIGIVEAAERNLNINGSSELLQVADEYANDFLQHIDEYLDHVVSRIEEEVGRCGPVSTAYNATVIAVCNNILDPFNGFWSSVGWCLVFFLPCIIIGTVMVSLYRKTEAYQGPLFEPVSDGKRRARRSTYQETYDNRNGYAYSDRDNIPLADVSDGKRRARRSTYQETYDNRNGYAYSPDYTPPYNAAAVARPDNRNSNYSGDAPAPTAGGDTEPKNIIRGWDFPNGGPPGYTSPGDTPEYERPPPYYFPGPGGSAK